MAIAEDRFFTKEHIEANRASAPASLAELAVHCLEMVAELSNVGLDFTFKGGNSLLLLLEEPRRFSIDADIATSETKESVDSAVKRAVEKFKVFTRIERRSPKTKPWLPMVSYELYFPSLFAESGESFIMLDAVLKKAPYSYQEKVAKCGNLFFADQSVKLPEISGILSDKLLTLGPTTLGIPLNKKKEAQRLKHVHDAALLTLKRPSLKSIRENLKSVYTQEIELQERTISLDDVLADTISFCKLPFTNKHEPQIDNLDGQLKEMVIGRAPFEEHLFVRDYSWNRLAKDSALAALSLTAAIKTNITEESYHAGINLESVSDMWALIDSWL